MKIDFNAIHHAPRWNDYDGFELIGITEWFDENGQCFREHAEDAESITFYSLFTTLKEGGMECIHDFEKDADLDDIRHIVQYLQETVELEHGIMDLTFIQHGEIVL